MKHLPPPVRPRPRHDESGVFLIRRRKATVRKAAPHRSAPVALPVEIPKAEVDAVELWGAPVWIALSFVSAWVIATYVCIN